MRAAWRGWLPAALLAAGCATAPKVPSAPVVWPPPPDPPRIEYVKSLAGPQDVRLAPPGRLARLFGWLLGRPGGGPALARPFGVAVSTDGARLYAADSDAAQVLVFNFTRGRVERLETSGSARMSVPIGVACGPDGRVYVTDADQRRVKVFDAQGRFLTQFGRAGEGPGEFRRPTGIAVDRVRGLVYVVDTQQGRVHAFSLEGATVAVLGGAGHGPGEFSMPTGAAVDREGNLYVVDTFNCRVQVFGPDGAFRLAFGEQGDQAGQFARPKMAAVDPEGHVYVTDAMFHTIQVFDGQGRLLMFFGEPGNGPGGFSSPTGVAADSGDRLYVADSLHQKIQVFRRLPAP